MTGADAAIDTARLAERRWERLATVSVVAATGSTNSDLAAMAADGAPDGTVLVAEQQTEGRGRGERRWFSAPRRDLLLSLLVRPQTSAERFPTLTFHFGLAIAEALSPWCQQALRLKWPNDLLLNGAKLAGILSESALPTPDAPEGWVVLGLGLNVNTDLASLPAEVRSEATSLEQHTGQPLDRNEVLLAVLTALDRLRPHLDSGHAPVERWNSLSAWRGEVVTVDQGEEKTTGRMLGIAEDGALMLEQSDGLVAVSHGDLLRLSE